MQIYQTLANAVYVAKHGKPEQFDEYWLPRIDSMTSNVFPSGSGFDSGTQFDIDKSTVERLVFHTAFHHMDDNGYYDRWTVHDVIVKPSLLFGIDIRVTGINHNGIKDYIAEMFHSALTLDERS